jgi:hypothetical protein
MLHREFLHSIKRGTGEKYQQNKSVSHLIKSPRLRDKTLAKKQTKV